MAKKVTLEFRGFKGVSRSELEVLFDHDAIHVDAAVLALREGGPGMYRELILKRLGMQLLEAGYFVAFARLKYWITDTWSAPSKTISRDFLLGNIKRSQECAALIEGLIDRGEVVLRAHCEVWKRERHSVFPSGVDSERIQPQEAYFWREKDAILAEVEREVLGPELDRRLAMYGLTLEDDPKLAWPIKPL